MVRNIANSGLIICTQPHPSQVFEELARATSWQILLEADARALVQQLESQSLELLLFWIEQEEQIAANARLLKLLRHRGPRPWRVVVAYQLADHMESAFRSLGVHLYLPIANSPLLAVEQGLAPLLARSTVRTPIVEKCRRPVAINPSLRQRTRVSSRLSHPP